MNGAFKLGLVTRVNVTPIHTGTTVVALPVTQAGILPHYVIIATASSGEWHGVGVMPCQSSGFTMAAATEGIFIGGSQTHFHVMDVLGFSHLAFRSVFAGSGAFGVTPLENF